VTAGQTGTVRLLVTVTGGLATTGNGGASVQLNYQVDGHPSYYTMFSSQVYGAASIPNLNSIGSVGLSGFSAVPGSMSGSGQVTTFAHAITFGTPIEFDLGLMAHAEPGASSTVDSYFQAYVSGIEVTGPLGQVLPGFTVVSASGAPYGPGGVTAVDGAPPAPAADAVQFAAAPNPSSSGTRLSYRLPSPGSGRLEIYDSAGRLVRRLEDRAAAAGPLREAWWNGDNDLGKRAPSGTYYARLRWEGNSRTVRVVVVR
jgi:hypothetical protein